MGLSAYGENDKAKNVYYSKLKKVIDVKEDGSFCLDLEYFIYHYKDRMPSCKLIDLLGEPVRKKEAPITGRHKDIAAALQMVTEEVVFKILNHLHTVTGLENLVMAGGVALNSVINGKVLKNTPFKNVWIQPAASDSGGSLGAAMYIYNSILVHSRAHALKNLYQGPSYSRQEVKEFFISKNIKFSEFNDERELIRKTAELVYADKIVAWFQGRMEWGPRALGSRSLLANPLNPDMKDILNHRVKHREGFRPFAPVICADDVHKYFECGSPIPEPAKFMLMVYPVKKEWRRRLPSITHVNGSGRLQVIDRERNYLYYDLIKEFGRLSGVPILINTSFNIRGEPIVRSPEDALNCVRGTGIDYLVIENMLVSKKNLYN